MTESVCDQGTNWQTKADTRGLKESWWAEQYVCYECQKERKKEATR